MDRYPYQPCSTWPPFCAAPRSAPAPRSEMMVCWQNGRRLLLHPDEVARLMKKQRASPPSPRVQQPCAPQLISAEREEGGERQSRAPDEGLRQTLPLTRSLAVARDHRLPAGEEREVSAHACDFTLPPIRARSRSLAQNEGWQMIAKEMVRVAGHPRRCHKPRCRRMKKCQGGENACYLLAFETVDVLMQRSVLPAIAKAAREAPMEP